MADRYQDTPAGMQAQQKREKEEKAEKKEEHDRLIESDTVKRHGKAIDRKAFKTDFMEYSVNGLRKMILDSDPGTISTVGDHWKSVHQILSGGDGDGKAGAVDTESAKGSIAGDLQKAVDDVLEHWEGQAAEAFKRRAGEIGVQIRNGAAYANFTAEQLFAISTDLDSAKTRMQDIHEPSKLESAGDKMNDDGRDDAQAMKDLAAGASADTVAKANEKNLSLGMERKLQAVAVMEELATNYKVYTQNLNKNKWVDQNERSVSPPNNNVAMPPPISIPSASPGGPSAGRVANKPWSAGPTTSIKPAPAVPRDPGIAGGSQLPTAKSSELPTARTNVDSISPGLTGNGPSTGIGGASVGAGGGLGTGGAQSAGIRVPGGAAGLAGSSAGGIGAVAGRGGLAGGAATGRGTAGRAGMGGMSGGAGAAGRGGASAGGRGALARARGGVVGAAKGAGKGAGGGAGLHGSRGGTQAGAAGGAGGKGRRSEKGNAQGDRPDYLVEDEETWISEEDRNRNVPRTIE
ncbi:hypothetical protein ACWEWI_17860 [Streptomyces sp. NPDC003753]|uniref:hypothetical protein n=1 Tax=Streptomyces sp. Y2F8-2 TaxID=2759675 RepID=UPI001908DE8F|nr:hypothetical protein [Streptomyces sp. Y2F8-2]GHK04763.1 hypothetical protein SY2F82_65600 [Streptomyces sp. Y2F8-2]